MNERSVHRPDLTVVLEAGYCLAVIGEFFVVHLQTAEVRPPLGVLVTTMEVEHACENPRGKVVITKVNVVDGNSGRN